MKSPKITALFGIFFFVWFITQIVSPIWLSQWTINTSLDKAGHDLFYLIVYSVINGFMVLSKGTTIALTLGFYKLCLLYLGIRASSYMHDSALRSLLRAPLSFFDINPVGRILNRMSSDVNDLDMETADYILASISSLATLLGSLIIILNASLYLICNFGLMCSRVRFLGHFHYLPVLQVPRCKVAYQTLIIDPQITFNFSYY